MYSSNPLGANAVIFNLLQCRITVTAAVKDLEDRQGNLHVELEGLGLSVGRKSSGQKVVSTQPSLLPGRGQCQASGTSHEVCLAQKAALRAGDSPAASLLPLC